MAISSINRVESRSDTPPGTPQSKTDVETQVPDPTTNSCTSKNCIHKMEKAEKKEKASSESDDSSDDSDTTEEEKPSSSSESEEDKRRKKAKSKKKKSKSKSKNDKKKGKRLKAEESEVEEKELVVEKQETDTPSDGIGSLKSQLISQGFDMSDKHNSKSLKLFLHSLTKKTTKSDNESSDSESETDKKPKKKKRASKNEYKRLDMIWDEDLYDYKLKETSDEQKSDEFDEYIFTVRRKFDNEGHYEETVVDIKSQPLKECLRVVMADVEDVSLVEDTPILMPNMLFIFLEELRQYVGELKQQRKTATKRKVKKLTGLKEKHLKKLVEYVDKDYDEIKKTLYPLLKNGRITFELLWALYKPNTLAYTSTYGDDEQPRAYKIQSVYKHKSLSRGTYYEVDGKYLDYNGKHFGSAEYTSQVGAFQGTRKITSLACYPIQYHADPEKLKTTLLERGKKFLTLAGQNYQSCKGMAFIKKMENVLKVNVNGRIMIDPGTFRRINPNYPIPDVEARLYEPDEEKDCCCKKTNTEDKDGCCKKTNTPRFFRLTKSDEGSSVIEVDQEDMKDVDSAEKEKDIRNTFTEEELLTANSVVLGFSFSEKSWLEFTVASIDGVTWNDGAFDSLVLPEKHKSIVKALVSAHGLHAAKGFDDIIAGKGKGLVAVLHGRPGLGKTLTCEAVSDLLKRPLYTVSAGDLGTNPTALEAELQAILDIAHTWNAVLLLDEADVFLEERSVHDVHRNALVSIFLRLLEYFQGILFLTTNRVATFDEAFVSRIHLSLRYNELTFEAKRSVWKTFIDKVRVMEGTEVGQITEKDFNHLARQDMNGRQIKNLVKTAQALALREEKPMGMEHIKRVIDVAKSFEMDLKGGSGYSDAMRSYS